MIYGGGATVIIVLAALVILRFGDSLLSVVNAPEMVVIPAGAYGMGEQRQRKVTVHKPFAIGRYEVTFDEYDRFARASGWELPQDSGWGRDRRPVINVAWSDAQAYAAWLSKKTGKRYRLPTEAEWEYAARGRGRNEIWSGTSEPAEVGIYAIFNMHSTELVGRRKPNSVGLYDMSGNVFEWVQDCWHESYKDAPTDGSAWLEANGGNCSLRVMRGGSWNLDALYSQASARNRISAVGRFNYIGFRLAQDLD
jgi:formylglycine-generating enzyme required for sulfatase activity